MSLSPASSHGGGSTFNGGSITTPLSIDTAPAVPGTPDFGINSAWSDADANPVIQIGNTTLQIYELDSNGGMTLTMRTGGAFTVGNGSTPAFRVDNQTAGVTRVGFFGAATVPKPVVAGAKLPSDVVLASLLTALSALGLVTDTST